MIITGLMLMLFNFWVIGDQRAHTSANNKSESLLLSQGKFCFPAQCHIRRPCSCYRAVCELHLHSVLPSHLCLLFSLSGLEGRCCSHVCPGCLQKSSSDQSTAQKPLTS